MTAIMVPSSDNDWATWAPAFAGYNAGFRQYLPEVPAEADWRLFADRVPDNPTLRALGAPSSEGFATWQAWVDALAATTNAGW